MQFKKATINLAWDTKLSDIYTTDEEQLCQKYLTCKHGFIAQMSFPTLGKYHNVQKHEFFFRFDTFLVYFSDPHDNKKQNIVFQPTLLPVPQHATSDPVTHFQHIISAIFFIFNVHGFKQNVDSGSRGRFQHNLTLLVVIIL